MSKPIRKTPSRALIALSDNLRVLCEQNEWTQAKLGEHAGLVQRQAGRILNRETEPTLETLSDIADHLKISEPLLICPGMSVDSLTLKPGIRKELRLLIDALIRLDNEGRLTDQVLTFLTAGLEMSTPGLPASNRLGKTVAQ